MRLDKLLADMGAGSRSDLKKAIRAGRVTVNGAAVRQADFPVEEGAAVTFDGKTVPYEAFSYLLLYKPAGVLSATEDPHRETVLDLVRRQANESGTFLRRDLAPVGRLDLDAEGLLLLTNDGQLAHELLSPKRLIPKTYFVLLERDVTKEDVRRFAEGLPVPADPEAGSAKAGEAFTAEPAKLEACPAEKLPAGLPTMPRPVSAGLTGGTGQSPKTPPDNSRRHAAYVTITEGRFHEVKRMFRVTGSRVLYLRRVSMGPLTLDPSLSPGTYRKLTSAELAALRAL